MKQLLSILSLLLFVSCNDSYDYMETTELLGDGDQDARLTPF